MDSLFLQAVQVASSIADRICINSKGKLQPTISARYLTACTPTTFGCNGGDELKAWAVWEDYGVVTGGTYGSKSVSKLN